MTRHRTHQSTATILRRMTHLRLGSTAEREPYPVLEVQILTPGPKSHHKEGDVVLWAEEDTFQ